MSWFLSLPYPIQILLLYGIAVNAITFFYFGIDKLKAEIHTSRIRERTLWLLSLAGGSVGALAAIHFFHHKTQKNSFQAVFVIILLLQVTMIFLLLQDFRV